MITRAQMIAAADAAAQAAFASLDEGDGAALAFRWTDALGGDGPDVLAQYVTTFGQSRLASDLYRFAVAQDRDRAVPWPDVPVELRAAVMAFRACILALRPLCDDLVRAVPAGVSSYGDQVIPLPVRPGLKRRAS